MNYQVKDPQGKLHIIQGPEGATPDQVVARAKTLIPEQADWKGVVGSAVSNAFMQPGTVTRKLATDPVAQAKALPPMASMAGAMSPIPGGATLFGEGARGLSDLALKSYGRQDQIPSQGQHLLELGGNVLGDAAAIPYLKSKVFGSQIGKAEQGAGVVARGATKAVTPGSVGETLNNLEAQIDAGTINNPQTAKDAKEIIDQIYGNESIYEKSPGIKVQAARVSAKVQRLLNSTIPGRAAPAQAMSQAMTIPRKIGQVIQSIPRPIRKGIQYGAGAAAGGGTTYEIIKRLMGG